MTHDVEHDEDIDYFDEGDGEPVQTTEKIAAACPFCGKADCFVERKDFSSAYVFCNDCAARGPVSSQESDMEEEPGGNAAIRAWNIRAPLQRVTPSEAFAEWANAGPNIAKAAGMEVEISAIASDGGALKLSSAGYPETPPLHHLVAEQYAKIADDFATSRPLAATRPTDLVRGRYEGEQAASAEIAKRIRETAPSSQQPPAKTPLDEIALIARAANPGPHHIYTHPRDDNNWKANAAFHEAITPQLVISLIEAIQAKPEPIALVAEFPSPSQQEADEGTPDWGLIAKGVAKSSIAELQADVLRLMKEKAELKAHLTPSPQTHLRGRTELIRTEPGTAAHADLMARFRMQFRTGYNGALEDAAKVAGAHACDDVADEIRKLMPEGDGSPHDHLSADDHSLAARYHRLHRVCARIIWTDLGVPAMGNGQTKAAMTELSEIILMDALISASALATEGKDNA